MKAGQLRYPVSLISLISFSLLTACMDVWVQPPRSPENLAALARVELRTYSFTEAGGIDSEYGIYVPTSYRSEQAAPLLVALHGHGSGAMYMMEYNNLVELAETYGFIVVTPVGFSERGWFGSKPGNGFSVAEHLGKSSSEVSRLSELDVMNVIARVRAAFAIDSQRIYLIGQSMGGGGTWYLASKYPDLWAAVAALSPVTGENPAILENFSETPVLLIAGDRDIEVDIELTREWVQKMSELGMDYEYMEIEGGTHSDSGRDNIARVFEFLSQQRL